MNLLRQEAIDRLQRGVKAWYRLNPFSVSDFDLYHAFSHSTSLVNTAFTKQFETPMNKWRRNTRIEVLFNGKEETSFIEHIGKNIKIHLDAKMLTPRYYSEHFHIDKQYNDWKMIAIALITGTEFHEILHAIYTFYKDKEEAYLAAASTANKDLFFHVFNQVEDIYINHMGFRNWKNTFGFFLKNQYIVETLSDQYVRTYEKTAPHTMTDCLNAMFRIYTEPNYAPNKKIKLTNGNSLSGLYDLTRKVVRLADDDSNTDRVGLVNQIVEYIYNPAEEVKQDKILVVIPGEGDGSKSGYHLTDAEKEQIKIILDMVNVGKNAGGANEKAVVEEPPQESSKIETYSDNKILSSVGVLRRLKILSDTQDRTIHALIGSKVNSRGLYLPDRMFLNWNERKAYELPPVFVVVVDGSGSMSSAHVTENGVRYSLQELVLKKGALFWQAINQIGIPCFLYSHTTGREGALVTRVLTPKTPYAKMWEQVAHTMAVSSSGNYDAIAAQAAINDVRKYNSSVFKNNNLICAIMSDGLPNSCNSMTGEEALIQLQKDAKKQHTFVYGMALVEDVVETNKEIYGENFVDCSKDMTGALVDWSRKIIINRGAKNG